MENNLRHWDLFADVDPKYTKPITGKMYKGTSPNPQYVIRCLTEMFGPVGVGFGWEIVAESFEPIGDEVLHWCRIKFWHTDRANTFEGYGQTKALMKTHKGMMLDEDAPKKSLTDAIVKCASHIGIAANIFLGRWDDSKYVAEVDASYREKEVSNANGTPNLPSAHAVEAATNSLRNADTLEALRNIWIDLPKDIQSVPAVIKAKDGRKAEIDVTPKPAPPDDLDGDAIPY